jgi:hypothetical protein
MWDLRFILRQCFLTIEVHYVRFEVYTASVFPHHRGPLCEIWGFQCMNTLVLAFFLSCSFSEVQKLSSSGLEPRTVFRRCGLYSCNLLFETNNFVICPVLLPYLFSKVQKPFSPGIEPRTVFSMLWSLFPLPPIWNKQLWSWCCFSIVLTFRATRNALTGTQTHDNFRSFDLSMFSSLSQGISMPNLVYICLSIVELKVNIHTQNFNCICKKKKIKLYYKVIKLLKYN